jgi:hypothetical protein
MGLSPTHGDENRVEPEALRSNWRGTAKTGAPLDELRPFPRFVLGCVFEPICVAPSMPLGRLVARDGV